MSTRISIGFPDLTFSFNKFIRLLNIFLYCFDLYTLRYISSSKPDVDIIKFVNPELTKSLILNLPSAIKFEKKPILFILLKVRANLILSMIYLTR